MNAYYFFFYMSSCIALLKYMRTYKKYVELHRTCTFHGVKYHGIGIYRYILHQHISEEHCADVCETHANTHTLTLSQAHKRPERRQPRKYAIWKREIVLGKIKHAERSKRKSILTLADPRCAGVLRVRVCDCVCHYTANCICLSVCVHPYVSVSAFNRPMTRSNNWHIYA